jgi:hypothetical protein
MFFSKIFFLLRSLRRLRHSYCRLPKNLTVPLGDFALSRLRRARVARAAQRTHRPCKSCGSAPLVCSLCARIWCAHCHPDGCPAPHEQSMVLVVDPDHPSVSPKTVREQPIVKPPTNPTKAPPREHRRTTRGRRKVDKIVVVPTTFKEFVQLMSGLGVTVLDYKHQGGKSHYFLLSYPDGSDPNTYQEVVKNLGWSTPSVTNFRQQSKLELIIEIP